MPDTFETIVTNNTETIEIELEERKRQIAYQLWEEDGRPEGQADVHWERACLVVMSLDSGSIPTTPEWLRRAEEIQNAATVDRPVAATVAPNPEIESIRKRIAARVAA